MKKKFTLLTLLVSAFTYSQVGIGTPSPNESAELEVSSEKKGVLIPRIALKSISDTITIEEGNVNSLLIFNTTNQGDLTPGYYYWYNDRWMRIINQSDDVLKAPWQIQNTENRATQNTDNIYQQGKVAVGVTKNDTVRAENLYVKGITLLDGVNTAGINAANLSIDNSGLFSEVFSKDGGSNSSNNKSRAYFRSNYDGEPLLELFSGSDDDKVGGSISLRANKNNKNSGFGFVDLHAYSYTSKTNGKNAYLGLDDEGVKLGVITGNFEYDGYHPIGNAAGAQKKVPSYYYLPKTSPVEGQVLMFDSADSMGTGANSIIATKTKWGTPTGMPQYFYAPSIVLPTEAADLPDYVTVNSGTFTIDLHANVYARQFGMTDPTSSVKSPTSTTLPIIEDADKLEYFITYYDKTVFTDVAISDEGVLSYTIAPGATVTEKTYMNIVFKVR